MKPVFDFSEIQVFYIYNGAILSALAFAYFSYFREALLRKYPLASWFTFIAILNVLLALGTRFGAYSWPEWQALFRYGAFAPHRDVTIVTGLFLALPAAILLKKFWRLPADAGDAMIIGLPMIIAIGRIGCIGAGCCFGTECHLPWAVSYGAHSDIYDFQLKTGLIGAGSAGSLPAHPVQIYDLLANLAVFIFAVYLRKRWRNAGSVVWFTMAGIFLARFGVEFFREPLTDRGELYRVLAGLKLVQWATLAMAIPALLMLWRNEQRLKPIKVRAFKPMANSTLAAILLLLSIMIRIAWRGLLPLEMAVLLVSFGTAWGALAVQWYRELNVVIWQKALPVGAMSVVALLMVAEIPVDSLKPRYKPAPMARWLEVGSGYNQSQFYNNVQKGQDECGPTYTRYQRQTRSGSASFSYHEQKELNTEWYAGVRGSFGELQNQVDSTLLQTNFYSISPFVGYEDKWLGLQGGIKFNHWNTDPATFQYKNSPFNVFYAGLRVGLRYGYFADVHLGSNHNLEYFPEPRFQLGLANYGFKDHSGCTSLGFGLAVFEQEPYAYLSAKAPILHKHLLLNGSVYFTGENAPQFNFGLIYRTR